MGIGGVVGFLIDGFGACWDVGLVGFVIKLDLICDCVGKARLGRVEVWIVKWYDMTPCRFGSSAN